MYLRNLMHAAMDPDLLKPAVDAFTAELLRAAQYARADGGEYFWHKPHFQLWVAARLRGAWSDLCVKDANKLIHLIVENKSIGNTKDDPEAKLVAESLATFRFNNTR